jgi:hypothetical protein
MSSPRAEALAAAFLTSESWTQQALAQCGATAFGVPSRRRWLAHAARRTVEQFPRPPRSQFRELVLFIEGELAGVRDVPAPRRVPVPVVGMGRTPWSVVQLFRSIRWD